MTISASETLIRYLGPSEAYFWLSNQNSWKHFVVAAQIKGETTTASWRTALDAVQRRHPLLGVCIDADDSGAPFFRLSTSDSSGRCAARLGRRNGDGTVDSVPGR